jgi:hypothetical protein
MLAIAKAILLASLLGVLTAFGYSYMGSRDTTQVLLAGAVVSIGAFVAQTSDRANAPKQ